jgi:hypothetical protein
MEAVETLRHYRGEYGDQIEVVRLADGAYAIRDGIHLDACHTFAEAVVEARQRLGLVNVEIDPEAILSTIDPLIAAAWNVLRTLRDPSFYEAILNDLHHDLQRAPLHPGSPDELLPQTMAFKRAHEAMQQGSSLCEALKATIDGAFAVKFDLSTINDVREDSLRTLAEVLFEDRYAIFSKERSWDRLGDFPNVARRFMFMLPCGMILPGTGQPLEIVMARCGLYVPPDKSTHS